jgi:hypothetical protein
LSISGWITIEVVLRIAGAVINDDLASALDKGALSNARSGYSARQQRDCLTTV